MAVTPLLAAPSAVFDERVHEARSLVRRGRITTALAGLATLSHALAPADRALLAALEIECLLARGDLSAAVAVAEGLVGPGDDDDPTLLLLHRYARAEVAAASGRSEEAVELFLAAGDIDEVTGAAESLAPWRAGAALAMLRLGRRREALALAREQLHAVVGGAPYDVAGALRVLATTEPDGRGIARLREAQELVGPADAARLRAQIDTDLAGLLVLAGGGTEAIALLRGAEAYAGREDLWPLHHRIRRLLERLGETPRRMESEALAVLTAAERRVALLVLDGHTNRQIAATLLVSVKAVEGHLSKVYRKLGVASRGALTSTLRVTG